ncbi:hypothetical protein H6G54_29560 [Anabaena cylindrica FACHB-243]|uniref:Uncharacterized protein n=1 Tax=Anabaena cylindrica (strain ATCC 27899 / PCC 7122) TaxID=272123 RepID=K9ZR43_ANACC|nr:MULTISPECIES: hypothetical protein [Anabaena]AFZ61032.1 hypothetical protein Anacy_5731 [Anabaena cylindrica PCC 7122]MBD2421749.1 hypothetical protein [Anabaena cylindrica FACHB-243]MBY5281490.1 hypothetical protein [Anabaena sp. CCAP 1446/1C]MBY5309550.1 hypothetical protein [Anabaena sp. CCAP 1446/1C]MCM2408976.1 hypothetical protein [Anabaena sp. CCAP 1446/1C]
MQRNHPQTKALKKVMESQKQENPRKRKLQQQQIKALEKVMGYPDKVRLMVLEVLREESGRELAAKARFNQEEFDWNEHNTEFRQDYADTSINELLAYAKRFYGLKDLDAVRERSKAHKKQRTARFAEAS